MPACAVARLIAAIEHLEQARQLVLRNGLTVVLNGQQIIAGVRQSDGHAPVFRRILGGVLQQAADGTPQQRFIAADTHAVRNIGGQAAFFEQRRVLGQYIAHQRGQIECFAVFQLVRAVQTGVIQHFAHKAVHPRRFLLDSGEIPRVFLGRNVLRDGLGVPADERKRRFQVVACRRNKLLAFVLEVALAVPAGVQSRRHFAQRTVEFTDFVSAFQVGLELVECKVCNQIGFSGRFVQWVGNHAAHELIEQEQKQNIQRVRHKCHAVKVVIVCRFPFYWCSCNDYSPSEDRLIRTGRKQLGIFCFMFVFDILAINTPQLNSYRLSCRKVCLHAIVLVKAPLNRCCFPLTDFLNRCLCRPFIIIRTYADSVRNIYRMTIVFDFFAIYHCNVSHAI